MRAEDLAMHSKLQMKTPRKSEALSEFESVVGKRLRMKEVENRSRHPVRALALLLPRVQEQARRRHAVRYPRRSKDDEVLLQQHWTFQSRHRMQPGEHGDATTADFALNMVHELIHLNNLITNRGAITLVLLTMDKLCCSQKCECFS